MHPYLLSHRVTPSVLSPGSLSLPPTHCALPCCSLEFILLASPLNPFSSITPAPGSDHVEGVQTASVPREKLTPPSHRAEHSATLKHDSCWLQSGGLRSLALTVSYILILITLSLLLVSQSRRAQRTHSENVLWLPPGESYSLKL